MAQLLAPTNRAQLPRFAASASNPCTACGVQPGRLCATPSVACATHSGKGPARWVCWRGNGGNSGERPYADTRGVAVPSACIVRSTPRESGTCVPAARAHQRHGCTSALPVAERVGMQLRAALFGGALSFALLGLPLYESAHSYGVPCGYSTRARGAWPCAFARVSLRCWGILLGRHHPQSCPPYCVWLYIIPSHVLLYAQQPPPYPPSQPYVHTVL